MEESTFYMAIENPRDFRRELLGTSKMVIQLLQRYEHLKKIREQKVKLIYDYNETSKEINALINRLKRFVPQTNLRNITEKKIITTQENKTSDNDLRKLHQELADIESKLGKLKN